jgi:hypothetical protein
VPATQPLADSVDERARAPHTRDSEETRSRMVLQR